MLDSEMLSYLEQHRSTSDPLSRLKAILEGFITFFPFRRASVFTYSPLNNRGEGILQIDNGVFHSMTDIQEDVRTFPAILRSITQNRPCILHIDMESHNFPEKYVLQFQLTTLLIVPICYRKTIIGSVLIDRFIGNEPISNELLMDISHFFQMAADNLFPIFHSEYHLSNREKEVLQRLADGATLEEMAHVMGVSKFTVRDYLTSVNRKLGAKHRAEAVAIGLRTGVIV